MSMISSHGIPCLEGPLRQCLEASAQLGKPNDIIVRNTPSTAGNSMTSSERPSPEPILKKGASPAVLGGREFWKRSGRFECLEL